MKETVNWNKAKYLFPGLIIVFSLLMPFVSVASLWQGIRFGLFQIGGVLIPGMVLAHVVRLSGKKWLEWITVGYGFGFALNILNYYITVPFGGQKVLPALVVAELLLSIGYLIKNAKAGKMIYEEDRKGNLLCLFLIVCILIFKFFVYYIMNKMPTASGSQTFYTADLGYYVGNAVELTKGYPPMNFRWYTQIFRYHFWGSLQLASMQLCMGEIAMRVLEFCFAYIQGPILLVLIAYQVFQRITTRFTIQICGMLAFLCCTGLESVTHCTYVMRLYMISFGFDYGLAFVMYTIYFVLLQSSEEKLRWNLLFATTLSVLVAAGMKAPIVIILMIALGLWCAYELLVKRRLRGLLYGIFLLAGFLLIYFTVVSNGFSTLHSSKGLSFGWFHTIMASPVWNIYEGLLARQIPGVISMGITVLLYLLICNPTLYIVMGAGILWQIKAGKQFTVGQFICLFTSVCSILFSLGTYQDGKSQIYFMIGGFPFVILYCISMLERWSWEEHYRERAGKIKIALGIVLVSVCILSIPIQFKDSVRAVVKQILNIREKLDVDQCNLVTEKEGEAYEWLREHTGSMELLVSNVMLQEHQGRSFVTGMFTERHIWMEGWEYGYEDVLPEDVEKKRAILEAAYDMDQDALERLRRDGVTYMICVKRISPHTEELNGGLETVYENEEVCVYRL